MNFVRDWFDRHLSDPQVVGLAIVLVVATALVVVTGDMLAPVFAAVVIAYLLEGLVSLLERYRTPRLAGVVVVFGAFMTFLFFVFFALLPLLSRQTSQLVQLLPTMLLSGQDALLKLPETYPELFSRDQVRDLIAQIRVEAVSFGQRVVSGSLSSVIGVITLLVYLILLPLMVFFFLKDKHRIVAWTTRFMPDERRLLHHVWMDVDRQIGNYVRGKFIEVLIVWVASYITFAAMGLQFAMLLAVAVGLSVVIPYIGAVVVTLPVVFVAYFQWGLTSGFCLPDDRVCHHSGARRQRSGALAVLGGRRSASGGDNCRSVDVRRTLGILGGLFRDPARDRGAGGTQGVARPAEGAAAARGGIRFRLSRRRAALWP